MGRHHYREGEEPVPGYRLVRWLGEGGFGVAWKATAPGGTEVAMKMIDLSGKNAHKEIRALGLVKRIRHPNLTPILALWLKDADGNVREYSEADSQEFLAKPSTPSTLKNTMLVDSDAWRSQSTELIMAMGLGDKTLSDRLDECTARGLQGIPPDELLEYLEAAAKAIDYLNSAQHNIQHCDIKPQNILIVGGAAQVCDFGLARAVQDNRMTKVAVSYAYAAPESFQSKPSHATDQYSLAITYVELRTGALPFDDESAIGVMNAHMNGTLNLARLPEDERDVIRRATAVNPDERYDSALKMVRALRRAFESTADQGGTPASTAPATPVAPSLRVSTTEEIVPGYRLQRLIHRGSTEEVWEATAPGGKHVALVIRELAESAAALDLEALSLVLRLGHPNLTEMLAFWLIDQEGIVLPDEQLNDVDRSRLGKLVLAGKLSTSTLLQLLSERRQRTGKGIPVQELLPLMQQVATALDFLNSRQHRAGQRKVGVLHCNVQPANLLLYGQTVRLGNFGRARALHADMIEDSVAAAGFEMAYTPPEVFEGELTRWTDQYGLALSYVHLRAGKPAFDAASSTTRLIQLHRSGELDFRELPQREVEVLRRATALVPRERFNTCAEFLDELRRACQSTPTASARGADPAAGAPGEKRKTEPIVSAATEVLDVTRTSTQDTTPPEDSSVIETQPLIEPRPSAPPKTTQSPGIGVTAEWNEEDHTHVARPAKRDRVQDSSDWQGGPPPPLPPKSRTKLLVAGSAAAALLVAAALAWPYLKPTPVIESEKDGTKVAKDGPASGDGEVVDQDDGETQGGTAGSSGTAPFDDAKVKQLESLFARANELPPRGSADPVALVDELLTFRADPEFEDAFRQYRREETKFVGQLTEHLRSQANANDVAVARRIELLDRLIALNPQDVAPYLSLARWKLAAEDLNGARETLAAADKLSPQRAQRDEWLFLSAHVDVHDPQATAADVTRALTNLRDLLAVGAYPSSADVANMSRDLVALCIRNGEYLEPATAVMQEAYARVPDEAVKQAYAALLVERLEQQLRTSTDPKFDTWLDQTATVESIAGDSPLVGLVRAECLIETAAGRSMSANEYANVVRLIERPAEVPDEMVPYASYVRALVRASNPRDGEWSKVIAELDSMSQALGEEVAVGFAAPHRRENAGKLFAEAGHQLRASASGARPVERIVNNPYGENARRAFELLRSGQSLLRSPASPILLADLALAAYYGAERDAAREAAEALRPQLDQLPQDRRAIRWVLARTQADDTAGGRVAIEETAALVGDLATETRLRDLDPDEAVRFYQEIVAPALVAADLPDTLAGPAERKSAARLFATKGQLYSTDYPGAEWGLDGAARTQAAYEAFNRAVELDQQAAEYLVGRAKVRQHMADRGGEKAAMADLLAAIELDPKFADAHYQQALLISQQAKAAGLTPDERVKFFEQARQACEQAIAAAAPKDPERANYLITLANAHVNLANYTSDSEGKQSHLESAERHAQEAVEDRNSPYLELAYRVLGNAQEDLAWIVGRHKPELEHYYADAVQSFELARNLRPDLAQAWRDLGRAQYKSAADRVPEVERMHDPNKAKERFELLALAEENAEQALSKSAELNDARYWSAMARYRQGKYLEACERFSEYFAADRAWVNFYMPDYAQAAFQGLQGLQDSIEKGLKRDSPEVQARIAAARVCAVRLKALSDRQDLGIDPTKAALALESLADALDGKADQALPSLVAAIPDRERATIADNELLASRIHTRLLASPAQARAVEKVKVKEGTVETFEVVLDASLAADLAMDPSLSRRVVPFSAAAWAYFKAYNLPATASAADAAQQTKLKAFYRRSAIRALRLLIATDPHHSSGWNWRVTAATLLKEEIANGIPNAKDLAPGAAPATAASLREEAQVYVRYALDTAPEEERSRLRRLLSEITAQK